MSGRRAGGARRGRDARPDRDARLAEALARLEIAAAQRNVEAAARIVDELAHEDGDGAWLVQQFAAAGVRAWARRLSQDRQAAE